MNHNIWPTYKGKHPHIGPYSSRPGIFQDFVECFRPTDKRFAFPGNVRCSPLIWGLDWFIVGESESRVGQADLLCRGSSPLFRPAEERGRPKPTSRRKIANTTIPENIIYFSSQHFSLARGFGQISAGRSAAELVSTRMLKGG